MMTQEINNTRNLSFLGVFDPSNFDGVLKVAETLMRSQLVPEIYRVGTDKDVNSKARANVMIALNMAQRMQADPLMVMQNLYVVKGRPAWSAQFLIACFNTSGKFSAIQYKFSGEPGTDDYGCQAWAVEYATNQKIEGTKITIGMCKKEKWWTKIDKFNNETSKWQSMPEQMFRYRAATFFIRATAPEIAMGLETKEEIEDIRDVTPEAVEPLEAPKRVYTNKTYKGVTPEPKEVVQEAEVVKDQEPEDQDTVEVKPEPEQKPQETKPGSAEEIAARIQKNHKSFKQQFEEQEEFGL